MTSVTEGFDMKTRKKDPEVECRKRLKPFVKALVQADAARRQQLVASVSATAMLGTIRILAEELIEQLDDDGSHAGAVETLVALGPPILPTLESALLAKPSERRLRHLAAVAATVGQMSPGKKRTDLQMTLLIAAGLAPTRESRFALDEAACQLREDTMAGAPA
jgi:hypothetical protein